MTGISSVLLLTLAACEQPSGEAPAGTSETGKGICLGSPYTTIQAAIDAAPDGGTVLVCNGTFHERLVVDGKRLVLRSKNGAANTTIDADTGGAGLEVTGGADVTVQGFTFTNGYTTSSGGNVSCADSNPVSY